jgi:hypothetical protein
MLFPTLELWFWIEQFGKTQSRVTVLRKGSLTVTIRLRLASNVDKMQSCSKSRRRNISPSRLQRSWISHFREHGSNLTFHEYFLVHRAISFARLDDLDEAVRRHRQLTANRFRHCITSWDHRSPTFGMRWFARMCAWRLAKSGGRGFWGWVWGWFPPMLVIRWITVRGKNPFLPDGHGWASSSNF